MKKILTAIFLAIIFFTNTSYAAEVTPQEKISIEKEVKVLRLKEVGASCFIGCCTIASIESYIVSTGVNSRPTIGTMLPCRTSDTLCNA